MARFSKVPSALLATAKTEASARIVRITAEISLNQNLNAALSDPPVRKGLEHLFVEVGAPESPEKFRSFVQRETTQWANVVGSSGIKAE